MHSDYSEMRWRGVRRVAAVLMVSALAGTALVGCVHYDAKPLGAGKVAADHDKVLELVAFYMLADSGQRDGDRQVEARPFLLHIGGREGLELGLIIARWIVSAHNGSIKIESVAAKLTTLTVTLPLLRETA